MKNYGNLILLKMNNMSDTIDYTVYLSPEEVSSILKMPEILRSEVRWLNRHGYWDGIMSGVLLYKNKKYWFTWIDENEDMCEFVDLPDGTRDWYRKYGIFEMSEENQKEIEHMEKLFYDNVATYSTYDENEKPILEDTTRYIDRGIPCALGSRSPELHHIYYDEMKKKYGKFIRYEDILKLRKGKPIGWFKI